MPCAANIQSQSAVTTVCLKSAFEDCGNIILPLHDPEPQLVQTHVSDVKHDSLLQNVVPSSFLGVLAVAAAAVVVGPNVLALRSSSWQEEGREEEPLARIRGRSFFNFEITVCNMYYRSFFTFENRKVSFLRSESMIRLRRQDFLFSTTQRGLPTSRRAHPYVRKGR